MFTRIWFGELKGKPINYAKFVCDYESDINTLPTTSAPSILDAEIKPCSVGSIAICTENQGLYVLNNQDEWVLFRDGTSGGGGTGGTIEAITGLSGAHYTLDPRDYYYDDQGSYVDEYEKHGYDYVSILRYRVYVDWDYLAGDGDPLPTALSDSRQDENKWFEIELLGYADEAISLDIHDAYPYYISDKHNLDDYDDDEILHEFTKALLQGRANVRDIYYDGGVAALSLEDWDTYNYRDIISVYLSRAAFELTICEDAFFTEIWRLTPEMEVEE